MFSHSNNSQFQYIYFLAGKAHTADEAYRVIKDQLENREQAIKNANAAHKRAEAKRLRAQRLITGQDIARHANERLPQRLEAEADLLEIEAGADVQRACYEEAVRERDFLQKLLERLEPLRKYRHLPDHEAMQACQREEWALELMFRAENFLAGIGSIPPDQIAAMRQHPDFEKVISPHVARLQDAARARQPVPKLPPPTFLHELENLLPEPQLPGYSVNLLEKHVDKSRTGGVS